MRAYSEDYLFDAMEALGEAFDCAANRAGLGLGQFFEMFVATGVADAFGAGAPRYVSGSSGIELVLDVCYRAGLDVGVPLADMAADGEGARLLVRLGSGLLAVGDGPPCSGPSGA